MMRSAIELFPDWGYPGRFFFALDQMLLAGLGGLHQERAEAPAPPARGDEQAARQ